jgi:hypothetical protein
MDRTPRPGDVRPGVWLYGPTVSNLSEKKIREGERKMGIDAGNICEQRSDDAVGMMAKEW